MGIAQNWGMSTVNNLELVPGCLRQCAHAVCKELPGADAFLLGQEAVSEPAGRMAVVVGKNEIVHLIFADQQASALVLCGAVLLGLNGTEVKVL